MDNQIIFPVGSDRPIVSVDDDAVFHKLFEYVFARSGLVNELRQLLSGRDCLDYFELVAAGVEQPPELVLIDLNMPGMDGFELIEALIRHHGSNPALFANMHVLTSSHSPEDRNRVGMLGVGYFIKPMRMVEVSFAAPTATGRVTTTRDDALCN